MILYNKIAIEECINLFNSLMLLLCHNLFLYFQNQCEFLKKVGLKLCQVYFSILEILKT